jgi:hypothetical protein
LNGYSGPRPRTLHKLVTLVSLALACVLVAAAPASAAKRQVPFGFLGSVVDPSLALSESDATIDAQYALMAQNGIESIRTNFYWSEANPAPGVYDWTLSDRIMLAAGRHGLDVLPIVEFTPLWASSQPGNHGTIQPPADFGTFKTFMSAIVQRYGPTGSFWLEHPELKKTPIRDWQIWNEPDATKYWSDQPFVPDYTSLLKASRPALRSVDKGARAVLAGFPSRSWVSLARLYAAGAKRYFDVAAVHPFSLPVANIPRILLQDRRVMAKYHDDKKPFFVTETSWPSAKGKTSTRYGFEVTPSGQAAKAKAVLNSLAKMRTALHVERLYWYTWISLDSSKEAPFDYAGLQTLTAGGTLVAKPAFGAFTRTALKLEGCRSKRAVATSCNR